MSLTPLMETWFSMLMFIGWVVAKCYSALLTDLQGKNRQLSHMISAVNAFKAKLCFWTTHLKGRKHIFPTWKKFLKPSKTWMLFTQISTAPIWTKLQRSQRFGELDIMEDIAAFVSNPFQSTDVEKVSVKFQQVFGWCIWALKVVFGAHKTTHQVVYIWRSLICKMT